MTNFLFTLFLICQVLLLSNRVRAGDAEAPTLDSAARLQALIKRDPTLIGYWPFDKSLNSIKGDLKFQVGGGDPVYRPGPLHTDMSLDLSGGRFASIEASTELESPDLTIEMIFRPRYITSGVLCGIRNGSATRFSLHYEHGSSHLKLWNGNSITIFESDTSIENSKWFHLVLSISNKQSVAWINGKSCSCSGDGGVKSAATGLPLMFGTSENKKGASERGEILLSHLAVYSGKLAPESIAARMIALGWSERLKVQAPAPVPDASEIEARVKAIKASYGVTVFYQYASKNDIPSIWREAGEPVPIPPLELARTIAEIEGFLESHPKELITRCLEDICIFGRLKHGGLAAGKSISVLVNRPEPQTRATLYHEFSHLLQVAYPVPKKTWEMQLPKDFKYGAKKANPFYHDDSLRSEGFIIHYSTANMHEEFAVLSDYVFVRKEETRDMMEKYPAIKQRVAILVQYYKSLSPKYNFSYYDDLLTEGTNKQ